MCVHLTFEYRKAAQCLNYFAIQEGGKINKMKALKLVYFADRFHLRKYGRPITNDEYFAMKKGPVPSNIKDICEMNDIFFEDKEKNYYNRFLSRVNKYEYRSIAPLDANVLSESDVEALQHVWKALGSRDQYELAEITHLYPEWMKHEESLKTNPRIRMNIEDFLDDSGREPVRCYELNKDEKADRIDQLKERSHIESLWD
ncbi:MAG: Panacea domain-containing protein [Candidatus Neomarinimicrobiota bacterium]